METRSFTRRAPASAFFVVALALGAVANGCAREPSMASKSAAAYQEAVDKGLPIGSGHGGHDAENSTDHSGMTMPAGSTQPEPGVAGGADEHSEHAPTKAGTDAEPMAGMDHSKPGGAGGSAPMAGMDHSQPVSGKPAPMAGMDHSKPNAETADPMAGMDHAAMGHGAMGHGSRSALAQSLPSPRSSSAIGQLDPGTTLAPDEFDQVVVPVPQVKEEQP